MTAWRPTDSPNKMLLGAKRVQATASSFGFQNISMRPSCSHIDSAGGGAGVASGSAIGIDRLDSKAEAGIRGRGAGVISMDDGTGAAWRGIIPDSSVVVERSGVVVGPRGATYAGAAAV